MARLCECGEPARFPSRYCSTSCWIADEGPPQEDDQYNDDEENFIDSEEAS